jgi:ABC-type antimicrobial peptide transport system permease subunit
VDVRAAIGRAAPDLPVVSMHQFEDSVAGGVFPQRLAAWTAGLVGAIGVCLAGLGLYGMIAFTVAQREREIAIRLALGARPHQVGWLVLGRAVRLAAAGMALGLALAVGLGRVLQRSGLLLGVAAIDPVTVAGGGVLVAGVVAAACYGPARRAATTNAAGALRGD